MMIHSDKNRPCSSRTVVVRGGGDIATGVIQKLWHAGFKVVVLETARPLSIRRTVALSSAVFEGVYRVEDMTAVLISSPQECQGLWERELIPVLVDPQADCLQEIQPIALVDAIIAKRNLGTHRGMAPVTIALGPGFSAPEDVDCVIETMRGHHLGRVISNGSALPNTGRPGEIGGKSLDRVIYAPISGHVRHIRHLGDEVERGRTNFRHR
jgi:xanthine dehydrogenase accessory factor